MAAAVTALALLGGCSSAHYAKSADRDTYALIQGKGAGVPNMDRNFTVEPGGKAALDSLVKVATAAEYLGPDGASEVGASQVTLDDSLRLAVRYSRAYQSRKEQLYLSALSLTLTRHQFAPRFSGSANGIYSAANQEKIVQEVDAVTGLPLPTVKMVEDQRITGTGSLGTDWLIRDVGRITTALTGDFTRFITGDPSLTTASQLSVTILRPLLRDSGFKQQAENYVQAERQMLYDLRDFTQFRKDFTVQVATAYYRVLGSRDSVRTSYLNLVSSRRNADRTRALAEGGRATQADLGRQAQAELNAENTWLNAVRSYRQQLDSFKIQIGLNVDTNIVLDDRELSSLAIGDVDIGVDESLQVALAARLDYQNAKDRLEDATRKATVAAGTLWPKLDLSATGSISSDPAKSGSFTLPDPDRYRWNAGLSLDPGFDKTTERNAYRSAIITRNSASRALEQQEDTIKLNVRESWRTLDQAKRSYEISQAGVQIAQRRVEEQDLLAELGRARAQDQVDAQTSLIESQNGRSQALVNHMVARLNFWNNLGLLSIRDDGKWNDLKKPAASPNPSP